MRIWCHKSIFSGDTIATCYLNPTIHLWHVIWSQRYICNMLFECDMVSETEDTFVTCYLNLKIQLWHVILILRYICDVLFESEDTFLTCYLNPKIHLCCVIWIPRYICDMLFESQDTFVTCYLNPKIHLWHVIWILISWDKLLNHLVENDENANFDYVLLDTIWFSQICNCTLFSVTHCHTPFWPF